MAYFDTCPLCGATLDPGETCDCQRVRQEEKKSREEAEDIRKAGTHLQVVPA